MSQLIESIKLLDGEFFNLHYHQHRMDHSVRELLDDANPPNLSMTFEEMSYPQEGLFKCRVIYGTVIRSIEFIEYKPEFPKRLKVVVDDSVEYAHKFQDRSSLDTLYQLRGDADDILIVRKRLVTDSYYHNVLFFDGRRWLTPDTPLLRGTMRQQLLDQAAITESRITVDDIRSFKKLKLINALVGFTSPEIDVSNIVF